MGKKLKIPAYYCQHWKDGSPSGVWWLANGKDAGKPDLDKLAEGFFVTYHPEQEMEIETRLVTCERLAGMAIKIKEYRPVEVLPLSGDDLMAVQNTQMSAAHDHLNAELHTTKAFEN